METDFDLKRAILWTVGVLFILLSLTLLTETIVGGLILLGAGVFLIPRTRDELDVNTSSGVLVMIALVALVAAGASLSPQDGTSGGPAQPDSVDDPSDTTPESQDGTSPESDAEDGDVEDSEAESDSPSTSSEADQEDPPNKSGGNSADDNTSTTTEEQEESSDASEDGVTVTVTEITDGDTFDIRYQDGETDTVRVLGVDTPEVHTSVSPDEFEGVPDNNQGQQCLRDWGTEASSFAESTLSGKEVRITFDENEGRRGYYDRLLAYVYVGDTFYNYELVEGGYARVYDNSQFVKQDSFYDAENTAQETNTGLWDECTSVSDESGTATSTTSPSGFSISQIHEDAAGNDWDNLNDEYVVFENTGTSTIDLSGWSVSDDAGHTYQFPSGFDLGSGGTVTLRTGSGTDTDSEVYWGSDSPIWNNGGDTVTVKNDAGEVVLNKAY